MQGYSSSVPGTASAREWLGGQICEVYLKKENNMKEKSVYGRGNIRKILIVLTKMKVPRKMM